MIYTVQVGSVRCHIVSDGLNTSDGGGFFGVVPRLLWQRVIPGNEIAVHRLANRCIRLGARVHYGEECGFHVSGHPSAGDVAQMIEIASQRHVLPIHGELRHLTALAEVARR